MTLGPKGRAAARKRKARLAKMAPAARDALLADLRAAVTTLPPGPAARLAAMLATADPPAKPRRTRAVDPPAGSSLNDIVRRIEARHPAPEGRAGFIDKLKKSLAVE